MALFNRLADHMGGVGTLYEIRAQWKTTANWQERNRERYLRLEAGRQIR